MTHEEYENLLKEMIEKPDDAAETAKSILAEIDKDATAYNEASAKATEEYATLEAKLKETEKKYNDEKVKNFLGTRGEDKKEPDIQEQVDEIIKAIINPPRKEGK